MENQEPPNDLWSRRRWLARLSLSFLIVACWLVYTGFQGEQHHTFSRGRVILCYVAAMLAFVLFVMGTRERHRPP
ncbi:MAG TPA: hypothetical protein VG269_02090 [Tepidisphaeraceae bacterium]|jgi:Na+/melibiose symporter-like transporter|nr:hypothetical protein [Tepidisphaeraceae bacterium]